MDTIVVHHIHQIHINHNLEANQSERTQPL